MEMSVNVVSYNIENLLYQKHITYRELGRRLNRDPATVSNHILEPRRLTLDEIIKIAAAIGVNWRDLLEGLD
jgi:plasmid maintenance system antidote protein VapI